MPHLNSKKRYLQIALNNTLDEAYKIIRSLPISDRIILEAGTPIIKRYGEEGMRKISYWYSQRLGIHQPVRLGVSFFGFSATSTAPRVDEQDKDIAPYIVADCKTMDRGGTEVEMASRAGASAIVALGSAPVETLNVFISQCKERNMDAMIDMMNVEYPLAILRKLKKPPTAVILHRGVDEEQFNREKQIPLYEIQRIKANYNILISVAGGDTIQEVRRAIFNDADIVVVWKSVFQSSKETIQLVEEFLKEIR